MALAVMARDWAAARGGSLLALTVDHGLRPESADEARTVALRLRALGIPHRILTLSDLLKGPALAERARIARYQALTRACAEDSRLHLLLGHHAADQAETLAMRALRNSRDDGLACMAALAETPTLRLLRPLLTVHPAELRNYLREKGIAWVEDPSNADRRTLRARLRQALPPGTDLTPATRTAGEARARAQKTIAEALAQNAAIRPEGFALVTGPLPEAAWGALVRTIAAAAYSPGPDAIATLPRETTLAGARIAKARNGWLVMREEAAIRPDTHPSALWDNRFRCSLPAPQPGLLIGRLGDDASAFRKSSPLPSAVLRTLPALRSGTTLLAVPHLRHGPPMTALFTPPRPAAGALFQPA
jgi:tRNA(Ile)-lysidine synthase